MCLLRNTGTKVLKIWQNKRFSERKMTMDVKIVGKDGLQNVRMSVDDTQERAYSIHSGAVCYRTNRIVH